MEGGMSKIFVSHFYNNGGWFRLFGRGIAWKNTRYHPLLFSQRNGYEKYFMIFGWCFTWLDK